MLEFHYNLEKVLESISYLLSKTESRELDILHLIKFLYFADRESIKEYNYPITGDSYSSLPYGPIVSNSMKQITLSILLLFYLSTNAFAYKKEVPKSKTKMDCCESISRD